MIQCDNKINLSLVKVKNKYNCTNRRQAQIIIICTVFFMKMLVVGAPTSIKEMKCQIF